MSTTKRFEMIVILGIVLVISGVENASGGYADHTGADPLTPLKYDRRGLGEAPAAGPSGAAGASGPHATLPGGKITLPPGVTPSAGGDIDIGKLPGAKGDGVSDMTEIINKAWHDACYATAKSKLIIPTGIWLAGMIDFTGPCTAPQPITIELQGTLKAKQEAGCYTDGKQINIFQVSVQIMGGGTIDGNGEFLQAHRKQSDKNLPDSVELMQCPDSSIEGIKFVNAKGFNLKVVQCDNFKANGLSITCGGDTLNTDGIHIARCKGASITNTVISVGDDCISIGDDTSDLTVKNIQCGPGHGISIGSLGRFPDEKDVRNIEVNNVTFTGTTNGVRIKTFHNSPAIAASNITFSDITVKDIYNPIVIDQHYNSGFTATGGVSKVKISGVTFRNVKGTTLSNMAVSLNCSSAAPCEGITLEGVSLTYTGNSTVDKLLSTNCENAKPTITGSTIPVCKTP